MYNVKIMDNQNSLAVLREDKKLQKQGILWRAEDNGVRSCNITKGILNLLSYDKTITNRISRAIYYTTSRGNIKQEIFLDERYFNSFFDVLCLA